MLTIHEENINEFLDNLAEKVTEKLLNNQEFITGLVENICRNDESRNSIVKEIMLTYNEYDFTYDIAYEITETKPLLEKLVKEVSFNLDYEELASEVIKFLKDVFKKINE